MRWLRIVLRMIQAAFGLLLVATFAVMLLLQLPLTVAVPGQIEGEGTAAVRAAHRGRVVRVLVAAGARVVSGDPVAELEDPELQSRLERARREQEEALASQGAFERYRNQVAGGLHPRSLEHTKQDAERDRWDAERSRSRVAQLSSSVRYLEEKYRQLHQLEERGVLPRLEGDQLRQELAEARAALEQARFEQAERDAAKGARRAEISLERQRQQVLMEELRGRGVELRQRLETARTALADLERERERLTVRADSAGVVGGIGLTDLVGRWVQPGDVVVGLVDDGRLSFVARLPESKVLLIQQGQPAYLELTALPRRRFGYFHARVAMVAMSNDQVQPGVASSGYAVRLSLERDTVTVGGHRQHLRPGMTGTAKIVYRPSASLLTALWEEVVSQ